MMTRSNPRSNLTNTERANIIKAISSSFIEGFDDRFEDLTRSLSHEYDPHEPKEFAPLRDDNYRPRKYKNDQSYRWK